MNLCYCILRWNGQKSANYRRVNWEKWEGANIVPQRHLQFWASLYLTPKNLTPKYLTPNNTNTNIWCPLQFYSIITTIAESPFWNLSIVSWLKGYKRKENVSQGNSVLWHQVRLWAFGRGDVSTPSFGSHPNPISTRGGQIMPTAVLKAPRIFRPCDGHGQSISRTCITIAKTEIIYPKNVRPYLGSNGFHIR